MTTHLANLTNKYHDLLLLDVDTLSQEGKEQHYDNLHVLSNTIANLEALQLQSVNEKIIAETDQLNNTINELSNTALSDDLYLVLCKSLSNTLEIMENLLSAAF